MLFSSNFAPLQYSQVQINMSITNKMLKRNIFNGSRTFVTVICYAIFTILTGQFRHFIIGKISVMWVSTTLGYCICAEVGTMVSN